MIKFIVGLVAFLLILAFFFFFILPLALLMLVIGLPFFWFTRRKIIKMSAHYHHPTQGDVNASNWLDDHNIITVEDSVVVDVHEETHHE